MMWLRRLWFRLFPGRWTEAEVREINRRAAERYARIQDCVD